MKITLKATPEDISPESAEKTHGYADGFAEAVRIVLDRIPSRSPCDLAWGWGTVEVKVEFGADVDKKIGYAHLGECSYLNAEDFIKNSAYFQDLVSEAIAGANPVKTTERAKRPKGPNLLIGGQENDKYGHLSRESAMIARQNDREHESPSSDAINPSRYNYLPVDRFKVEDTFGL